MAPFQSVLFHRKLTISILRYSIREQFLLRARTQTRLRVCMCEPSMRAQMAASTCDTIVWPNSSVGQE